MLSFVGLNVGNKSSKEGKKLIQLWVSQDKWDLLQAAAESVEEPITTFCRRAIYGTLRNWKVPAMKSENFAKCSICGKKHDEKEHYAEG